MPLYLDTYSLDTIFMVIIVRIQTLRVLRKDLTGRFVCLLDLLKLICFKISIMPFSILALSLKAFYYSICFVINILSDLYELILNVTRKNVLK